MSENPVQITRNPNGAGYQLVTQLTLPRPIEDVFPFFADAHQLQAITPPWLHFRVVSLSTPRLEARTCIDYRLRLRGIPLRWKTRIRIWDPPHRFVDEQLKGPYRWWRHEHRFVPLGGTTEIVDTVDYGVPFGPLLHPIWVRPDLRKIFHYRRTRLAELFSSETVASPCVTPRLSSNWSRRSGRQ